MTVADLEDLNEAWRQWVPGTTLPPYEGTNAYWIPVADGVWLVDPGDGGEAAQTALEDGWIDLGRPPVRGIFITHWHRDHSGGAAWAARRFGAPAYAGARELSQIAKIVPDLEVTAWPSGQTLGGAMVLDAPGHTAGELNLWFPRTRLVLAGDNVLGSSTTVVVPPDGHLRDYQATIRRLLALGPERIGPGHGPVVAQARDWLQYYLQHRDERERQILELLAKGPHTARELAEAIYHGEPPETIVAGTWMVLGHLDALQSEARVHLAADGRYVRLGEPAS
jgi:ribonuclease/clavin/mitogillin